MMLVQTENPIVAVRWPEGAIAQDEARIQLKASGVAYKLYDINLEHAPEDEPFEDGSFYHWRRERSTLQGGGESPNGVRICAPSSW